MSKYNIKSTWVDSRTDQYSHNEIKNGWLKGNCCEWMSFPLK
jgi:hypothetical protein